MTSKTTDGITVEYTYDGLGRITQQVTKNGETIVKTETYTFNPNSAQVATYRTQMGSYDVTYSYTYDDNGNILSVSDGTNTTGYVYDSQNQLVRENNQASNFTRTWTYDNAGNILFRKQYSYTAGELGTVKSTASYTYGDEDWGDLLTAYNGTAISYDNIGNPTSYRGMQFTWEHGRQLASAQYGSVTETYTYDMDGMRTGRTSGSNSYKYIYNGSQLIRMEYNSHVLEFTYDTQGVPLTVTYNGEVYYYITNLQGDVIRLVSETGVVQAQYLYDAWGTCATLASKSIGQLNPLRYRGYVYDAETGLYYLQSRYYDPTVGRFINADSLLSLANSLAGGNLFAYCYNNPVNLVDYSGHLPEWIEILIEYVVDGTRTVVNGINKSVNWVNTNVIQPVNNFFDSVAEKANSLPRTGTPGSSQVLPNPDGTPKQKRWYGPDGEPIRDRDYNHPGTGIPFPHDHEWKGGKRGKDHLPPSSDFETFLEPVAGIGLFALCTLGSVVLLADDVTGFGAVDNYFLGPVGAGFVKAFEMIFG